MSRVNELISDADIKQINDIFRKDASGGVIVKKGDGRVVNSSRQLVNPKGFAIKSNSFLGRTLKNNKSVIPVGGKQISVGHKGQKFDDIPLHLREQVAWMDSDFESV